MENTTDIPININVHTDGRNGSEIAVLILICVLFCLYPGCIIFCRNVERNNRFCTLNEIHPYKIRHNSMITKNNKLSKNYIQKLNKNNKDNNYCDCSICIQEIKNPKYNLSLGCGHNFHINCMQDWVQVKLEAGINPECPLCREQIITPS